MIFYKIKFNSFPNVRFAITAKTDKYKNIITHRKNYLELSIGGLFEINENGRIYNVPDDSVILITPDLDIKTKGVEGKTIYLTSVAVECDFDFERFDIDDESELRNIVSESKDDILLPLYFYLGNEYAELERLFKTLTTYYLKDTPAGRMQVISLWCEIISRIDTQFRQKILGNENENTGEYYSRKVKKYINEHFSEKLSVEMLAEILNISPNYLSRIFKRETGKTITEIIARVRLAHARELVYEGNMNFEEIAHKVGICNAKYMNKMFKKYYGISVHKCNLIDHEISLYHDKPWDIDELLTDIYNN